ncbi:MAG: serine/threonine-protein kinase [bacterium]
MEDIKQFEPFFGKWFLDEKLGTGSQSEVYRIHCGDQSAALRVIHIIPEAYETERKNFVSEQVEKIKKVYDIVFGEFKEHPNIVQFKEWDSVVKDTEAYIFERIELLQSLIEIKQNGISEEEIIKIGVDISNGLQACHDKNIIHRDVKLANIFFDGQNYKLGHFDTLATGFSSTVVGTPLYMAPEVFGLQQYDFRADIYSLGMTLYLLLSGGKYPFSDLMEISIKERVRGNELPIINGVNLDLMKIVLKACAFRPEERYRSITEFKNELTKVAPENKIYSGYSPKDARDALWGYTLTEKNNKNRLKTTDFLEENKNVVCWLFFTIIVSIIPLIVYSVCGYFIEESILQLNTTFAHEFVFLTIVLLTNMIRTIAFGKNRKTQKNIVLIFILISVLFLIFSFSLFIVVVVSETSEKIVLKDYIFWAVLFPFITSIFMGMSAEHLEDLNR